MDMPSYPGGVHDPKPLHQFAPTLAAHGGLRCGVIAVGVNRFLVFYGDEIQSSAPFETMLGALSELMCVHVARMRREAAEAETRG
jgi:hypothetical protein